MKRLLAIAILSLAAALAPVRATEPPRAAELPLKPQLHQQTLDLRKCGGERAIARSPEGAWIPIGLGTRCPSQMWSYSGLPPVALQPVEDSADRLWKIASAYPVLWLYVPATEATAFEFFILDERGKTVYEQLVELTDADELGLIEVNFEHIGIPALRPGQSYEWHFFLIQNHNDPFSSLTYDVQGKLKRTTLSTFQASRLARLPLERRLRAYERLQLWHDMLAELAQLYREEPENPRLARHWQRTLRRAGLAEFANAEFSDWEFPED